MNRKKLVTEMGRIDRDAFAHALKWFFLTAAKTNDTDISIRNLHLTLKEIVENEDKKQPYSDDALTEMLKEKGFNVARRTIAKYREQLGIPTSRMRKI